MSSHYDPFYSPASPVGQVRAERLKYLPRQLGDSRAWERTEQFDPSSGTAVDPAHQLEGAQLLRDYYKAVRRDRIVYRASMPVAFLCLGGLGSLLGWLFNNPLLTAGGIGVGALMVYSIFIGSWTPLSRSGAARDALESSKYFRDRSVLDGYLITTHDPTVIWDAVGLELQRQVVDCEAVRLRAHLHLPQHRETEIARLQHQEQELRQRIVDMLDPQHPGLAHLSDETRAVFAARVDLGRLPSEGAEEQREDEPR